MVESTHKFLSAQSDDVSTIPIKPAIRHTTYDSRKMATADSSCQWIDPGLAEQAAIASRPNQRELTRMNL